MRRARSSMLTWAGRGRTFLGASGLAKLANVRVVSRAWMMGMEHLG